MTAQSGGRRGVHVSRRPRAYQRTPQQEVMREAVAHCGIRKGMSREDLRHAMHVCIPDFYRQRREAANGEGQ